MRQAEWVSKALRTAALAWMCAGVGPIGAQTAGVSAAAQHAMDEGAKYELRKQLTSAADSYHAALKADGRCAPCLRALARVQMGMELYKDAAATATQLASAENDGPGKARAEQLAGEAMFQQYFAQSEGRGAIQKDPKKATGALKQAEASLQRGIADDPHNEPVRMLHARVLAVLKRDEDASREFAACAAMPEAGAAECAKAQRFAKDVSIARTEPAPRFSLKTLDGKTVSTDSLAGKIVLIDFWATWCGYCERDSDYVQSMLGVFETDRFVLLEVSVDENEAKWRNYVKEKRLEGLQTRDEAKDVAGLFHVSGFPTYIVLDGEGSVRLRAVGTEEGDLKGTVRKLLAESEPTPPDARQKLPKAAGQ